MGNILLPRDLTRATLMVGLAGATLTAVSVEGELLYEVGYEPGQHDLSSLVEFSTGVEGFQVEGGTVVFKHGRQASIRPPLHREVGANPEFKPSSERRQALMLERTVAKLQALSASVEKREKALQEAAKAVKPEPKEVEEPKAKEAPDDGEKKAEKPTEETDAQADV